MEKLTIQHIAPYLPYGLKIQAYESIYTAWGATDSSIIIDPSTAYSIRDCKPILYPISCLTKTIEHNGETFIPIVELAKIAFPENDWEFDKEIKKATLSNFYSFYFNIGDFYLKTARGEDIGVSNQWQLFQNLAEWHINFVGIPEGLYIDKNTLK